MKEAVQVVAFQADLEAARFGRPGALFPKVQLEAAIAQVPQADFGDEQGVRAQGQLLRLAAKRGLEIRILQGFLALEVRQHLSRMSVRQRGSGAGRVARALRQGNPISDHGIQAGP